jgi:hypothetical protein
MNSCIVRDNAPWGALMVTNTSNVILNATTFENNSANIGGVVQFGSCSGVIQNTIFLRNNASEGGGLGTKKKMAKNKPNNAINFTGVVE